MRQNKYVIEVLKDRKGFDNVSAIKAEYQLRIMLQELLFVLVWVSIAICTKKVYELLVTYAAFKWFRSSAGGIHVNSKFLCFIFSTTVLAGTIALTEFISIPLNIFIILALLCLWIWFTYIPKGTSKRPITSKSEIIKMQIKSGAGIIVTELLALFGFELESRIALIAMLTTFLLVTPLAYKIFRVNEFREYSCAKHIHKDDNTEDKKDEKEISSSRR